MREKLFRVIGNNQKNPFRGDGEICNCLPAAMGMGGAMCHIYFSDMKAILRQERTEFGKVRLKRMDMKIWMPREDGISNTLTGVTKDNYLYEEL